MRSRASVRHSTSNERPDEWGVVSGVSFDPHHYWKGPLLNPGSSVAVTVCLETVRVPFWNSIAAVKSRMSVNLENPMKLIRLFIKCLIFVLHVCGDLQLFAFLYWHLTRVLSGLLLRFQLYSLSADYRWGCLLSQIPSMPLTSPAQWLCASGRPSPTPLPPIDVSRSFVVPPYIAP